MGWAIFSAIFSQTHLVKLVVGVDFIHRHHIPEKMKVEKNSTA
jgi:hypothetical protein